MRLLSITWSSTPRLPGLRPSDLGKIDCDKPGTALEGWRVSVRNAQIFFISPPGWNRDQSIRIRDACAPRTVFGPVPLADVYLEWNTESDADLQALLKGKIEYESPHGFGWRPAPINTDKPILEQIPPGQMGDA